MPAYVSPPLSCPRRRASSIRRPVGDYWFPAFAGMTPWGSWGLCTAVLLPAGGFAPGHGLSSCPPPTGGWRAPGECRAGSPRERSWRSFGRPPRCLCVPGPSLRLVSRRLPLAALDRPASTLHLLSLLTGKTASTDQAHAPFATHVASGDRSSPGGLELRGLRAAACETAVRTPHPSSTTRTPRAAPPCLSRDEASFSWGSGAGITFVDPNRSSPRTRGPRCLTTAEGSTKGGFRRRFLRWVPGLAMRALPARGRG